MRHIRLWFHLWPSDALSRRWRLSATGAYGVSMGFRCDRTSAHQNGRGKRRWERINSVNFAGPVVSGKAG